MIPKVIHYCWFGRKEKPNSVVKYINSWKKNLPDFEIKEWNEDNFSLELFPFAKEAYECKKYAFVADVARLYALFNEGGVYFDTDVQVVRDFSECLSCDAFVSFEGDSNISTAVIGALKGSHFVKDCLEYYKETHFLLPDGSLSMTPNTCIISQMLKSKGLVFDNSYQIIENYLVVYPRTYFSAKFFESGKYEITDKTYCIHHFSSSWLPWEQVVESKIWSFLGLKPHRFMWHLDNFLLKIGIKR